MALVIPVSCSNWTLTLTNSVAGASSVSTISIGMKNAADLTQTVVDRVSNLLRDGLSSRLDASWTLGPVHVLSNLGGTLVALDDTGTEAGTHAAQANVAPGVALVVSKVTNYVGRSRRGRLYMPGLDETKVDEAGVVDGTELNAWQANFDALHTALIADAGIIEVSLFHDATSPDAGSATPINRFLVRNVVGSMRPRQRR